MQHIQLIPRYFNQEIIVYEVTDESVFVLCGQLIPEEEEEEEEEEKYLPMTIGIHKEHPSFITDLERQLKCMSVRTVGQDSHNHVSFYTMLQGAQTDKQKIVCRGRRIWAPESLYERTFHTRRKYG